MGGLEKKKVRWGGSAASIHLPSGTGAPFSPLPRSHFLGPVPPPAPVPSLPPVPPLGPVCSLHLRCR